MGAPDFDKLIDLALSQCKNLHPLEVEILKELKETWRKRCRGAKLWIAALHEKATGEKVDIDVGQPCQDGDDDEAK